MAEERLRYPKSAEALMAVDEVAPDFQKLITDFAVPMWDRPNLDRHSRRLIVIAALAALDKPLELKLHTWLALQDSVSKEEIIEVLLHISVFAGFPAAWNSLLAAREVFAEYEESKG